MYTCVNCGGRSEPTELREPDEPAQNKETCLRAKPISHPADPPAHSHHRYDRTILKLGLGAHLIGLVGEDGEGVDVRLAVHLGVNVLLDQVVLVVLGQDDVHLQQAQQRGW